ncbi:hypothetical protein [Microlunatus soli]|uniref:SseB protein N-terminal domain-containing protein n=1 Tax=Microlunatus soli TaxID=630515 RepID=A0A1H1NT24_9ACTN|nr:hypothetical protein [Microlunatus soli]SDS01940.1 hypothetical protein SAMN04489812_0629 [Microlunatus soli]
MTDVNADLDQLAHAAETDPAAQPALWQAAFALERWWFVARGVGPDGELGADVGPFIGVIEDKPFLMAFSSGQRARQFAVQAGVAGAEDDAYVLATEPQDFLSAVPSYQQQGVFAITFDHGTTGFFAPLANLQPIWEHVRQTPNG